MVIFREEKVKLSKFLGQCFPTFFGQNSDSVSSDILKVLISFVFISCNFSSGRLSLYASRILNNLSYPFKGFLGNVFNDITAFLIAVSKP